MCNQPIEGGSNALGDKENPLDAEHRRTKTSRNPFPIPDGFTLGMPAGQDSAGVFHGNPSPDDCQGGGGVPHDRRQMSRQGPVHGSGSRASDLYHRPTELVITPDAKAWVVSLACPPSQGSGDGGGTLDPKRAGSLCPDPGLRGGPSLPCQSGLGDRITGY